MKKIFYSTLFGVCAIEVALAVYHVPIANFTLIVILTIGGLVLLAFLKLMVAMLRDRADERRAWAGLAKAQAAANSQLASHAFSTISQLSRKQTALVDQCLTMGAMLVEQQGRYYAALPGGTKAPLDVIEADYWLEVAPDRVAGHLPAPAPKGRKGK